MPVPCRADWWGQDSRAHGPAALELPAEVGPSVWVAPCPRGSWIQWLTQRKPRALCSRKEQQPTERVVNPQLLIINPKCG